VSEDGLQQRGGDLEGQRDEADVREVQVVRLFDERVHGRDHRLDEVVEQVRPAQGDQDRQQRPGRGIGEGGCHGRGGMTLAAPAVN